MSAVHPAVPAAGTVADLAIVIPVWNLPEDLVSLLSQIEALGIFAEVVIADDASDLPCDPASLGFTAKRLGVRRLAYLRADQRGGAGHARNIGLQAVTARNVIFFDADQTARSGYLRNDTPEIVARPVGIGDVAAHRTPPRLAGINASADRYTISRGYHEAVGAAEAAIEKAGVIGDRMHGGENRGVDAGFSHD